MPLRVRDLTLCLALLLGAPLAAQTPAAPTLDAQTLDGRALDAAVDSLVRAHMADGRVAGLTVAVSRGGDLLHLEGYGMADVELDARTPRDAVYQVGSVTKQFTAVLALLLAEEGVLDLDADITEYEPRFRTRGRPLPVRRLLDHTSGMKGYTESAVFGEIFTRDLPPDTLLRLMELEPWDFPPGEGLIYNNTAYFLMGRILEEATGSTYAELLEDRLLGPLGMDRTHYCDVSRMVPGRTEGYQATPEGLGRAPYINHQWPYAAGSLCSTAADLVRWNRALHGGEVLSDASYRLLVTPEPLTDGSPVLYAKGLVHRNGPHGEVIEHGGGIFGFSSEVRYFPDDGLTLVVLQNTAGPRGAAAVVDGLEDLLRPAVPAPAEVAFDGDVAALTGRYVGPSRGTELAMTVTLEGGALRAAANGGEPAALTHVGDGVFIRGESRVWWVDDRGRVVGRDRGVGAPTGMRVQQTYGVYALTRR